MKRLENLSATRDEFDSINNSRIWLRIIRIYGDLELLSNVVAVVVQVYSKRVCVNVYGAFVCAYT